MNRILILSAALLTSLSAGCQRTQNGVPFAGQSGSPAGNRGGTQAGMQTVTFYDPVLHNSPAATLQIPAGWRFAGSAIHPVCGLGTAEFQFRIENADGSIVIQKLSPFYTMLSAAAATGLKFNMCGIEGPPVGADVVLTRYIVPTLGSGIKTGRLEVTPDSDPSVQAMHRRDGNSESWGSIADQTFEYTDGKGRTLTGVVLAAGMMSELHDGSSGGHRTSTTQLSIVAATAGKEQQSLQVFKSLNLQVLPAWKQQADAFASEFQREQIAVLQQQGRDQVEAINRQGEANRAALRQQGDARMAAIQADAQFHMQQSVQFAQQTIDTIHATGNASMNNARNQQQTMDDNSQRFIGYIADKPVSFKWCSATGGVSYSEYPPAGNWQHCP